MVKGRARRFRLQRNGLSEGAPSGPFDRPRRKLLSRAAWRFAPPEAITRRPAMSSSAGHSRPRCRMLPRGAFVPKGACTNRQGSIGIRCRASRRPSLGGGPALGLWLAGSRSQGELMPLEASLLAAPDPCPVQIRNCGRATPQLCHRFRAGASPRASALEESG